MAEQPLDASTRLAAQRTRLAQERTLMAWIRTCTSLIAFGFTIFKEVVPSSVELSVAAR
jgi:putative membrane protein